MKCRRDAVALACTEIPLLVDENDSSLPILDSTRLLAAACTALALTLPLPLRDLHVLHQLAQHLHQFLRLGGAAQLREQVTAHARQERRVAQGAYVQARQHGEPRVRAEGSPVRDRPVDLDDRRRRHHRQGAVERERDGAVGERGPLFGRGLFGGDDL